MGHGHGPHCPGLGLSAVPVCLQTPSRCLLIPLATARVCLCSGALRWPRNRHLVGLGTREASSLGPESWWVGVSGPSVWPRRGPAAQGPQAPPQPARPGVCWLSSDRFLRVCLILSPSSLLFLLLFPPAFPCLQPPFLCSSRGALRAQCVVGLR